MPKITIEFDSIEQASIAYAAVYGGAQPVQHAPAPAPVAPAPYAPAPAPAPAPHVMQAPAGFTPPMPPAPMAAPAPAPAPAPVAAAPVPAGNVTQAQLAQAAQAYAKTHGAAATKAVLTKYGIDGVAKCPPEQMINLFNDLRVA